MAKLNPQVIADAALHLLDEVGLDGITMRKVAAELDVQAPALYWHIKDKRELIDAMATQISLEAFADIDEPDPRMSWREWIEYTVERYRAAMLAHRDGAKVLAGSAITHPTMYQSLEMSLRKLVGEGFTPDEAYRVFPAVLHYVVGFTAEEQARTGVDYSQNPYEPDRLAATVDAAQYPLLATAVPHAFTLDPDREFRHGLHIILAGIEATRRDGPNRDCLNSEAL